MISLQGTSSAYADEKITEDYMKRFGFVFVLFTTALVLLAVGSVFVGCASTPAGPVYPFDGTAWTKSEEAELSFSSGEAVVRINGVRVAYGTNPKGTINGDGTLIISGNLGNAWAHYAGTWNLKSGDTSGDNRAGTVWTRTEIQTLEFLNGTVTMSNGDNFIIPSLKYRATDKRLTISLSGGSSAANYTVDGPALIISVPASATSMRYTSIGGTWTKQ
jgi:hypothetical protein